VGTFVMHPGVCPEYRNAHGCFWALAEGDRARVGMTLLKVDRGVDTGPVYGYYSYDFDELNESHVRVQHRVVLENLDALRSKLLEIYEGRAEPLDTRGRRSAVWGQPWLSRHLAIRRRARRERGRAAKAKAEG
jgi:methionyl-tRNA formyltransferase